MAFRRRSATLRTRTLVTLGILLAASLMVIYLLLGWILTGSVDQLEQEFVEDHVERARKLIEAELAHIAVIAADWAPWDDTYEFMVTGDQDYITKNAPVSSMVNLYSQVMVFIDTSGNIVYSVNVDLETEEEGPLPQGLTKHLEQVGLLSNFDEDFFLEGIILLEEGPLLMASHPILGNGHQGPSRGNLVIGRFLCATRLSVLRDKLNIDLRMTSLDRAVQSEWLLQLMKGDPIAVRELDRDTIAGYTVMYDIHGQPAIALETVLPRDIQSIGRNAVRYMLYTLLIVGLVFALAALLFLEKNVLSRLLALSTSVKGIGASRSMALRLKPDRGQDELWALANEINGMLDELSAVEQAARESEEKLRTFVEKASDIIYSLDEEGTIVYVSPNSVEGLGYLPEEITGQPVLKRVHPEDIPAWEPLLHTPREGRAFADRLECRVRRKDGSWNWYATTLSAVADDHAGSRRFVGILHDIHEKRLAEESLKRAHDELERRVQERTSELSAANEALRREVAERIRSEERVQFLAYHDYLTELPNRLLFVDRLDQAIRQTQRTHKSLAVMFLDLDNLKMVNDSLGHAQGDALLKEVAGRLSRLLRKSDTIARIGGDEFLILVQTMNSPSSVEAIVKKILAAFNAPFYLASQPIHVTMSVGVAVYPADGEDPETLIKNADMAMYKAKGQGRNRVVSCSPLMKNRAQETMKLTNSLYQALERNELMLHYQPQVSYSANKIIGLEALIRWQHPELGMIYPNDFIPIAENTGLIINIGEWVLRTACLQIRTWQKAGLPRVRVGINVSAVQFQNPGSVKQVSRILRDTGLDPSWLEIEITESVVIREPDHVIRVLQDLKKLGIKIAIDDFGTEYSSLSYLKQMPIDRIKIAMPFVRGIAINEKDEAIAKAIIVLAKSLDLNIIAEGVETAEQLAFLTQRMCDEIQGYYYYKPMPADEVEELLRSKPSAELSAAI